MSIIPGIFGMDNYYKPYQKLAHSFRQEDVGKKHMKVTNAWTTVGGPDCSYTGEFYTLMSIEYVEPTCSNILCSKSNAKLYLCSRCHQNSYCSKDCQKEDWFDHKFFCSAEQKKSPKESKIKKVILRDSKGAENVIDSTNWEYAKQYFRGWVCENEIKNVKPDTTISSSHIDQLKRWENGRD